MENKYIVDEFGRFLYQDDDNIEELPYVTVKPLESKVDTYVIWDKEKEEWYYEPYADAWEGCATPVPQNITPRQARIALLRAGLLDTVEESIKTNREFEIYWEYSLEVNRNDEMLLSMANQLGLTDSMLDSMFIEASKI